MRRHPWIIVFLILLAFACKKKPGHHTDNHSTLPNLRNDHDAQRDAVAILGGYATCEGYAEREKGEDGDGCEVENGTARGGYVCKGQGSSTAVVTCPPEVTQLCTVISK